MKVGVDQSSVSVSRCKKIGTLLCRVLTRVYPVVTFTLRFKWERNDAISLVTVKMGMVIPMSHGNLQITNYRGKYRGILPW